MFAPPERPRWLFYLNWILLTLLGLPLAFVLNLFAMGLLTAVVGDYVYVAGVRHITEDYLGLYTFVPLAGLLTGVMQYGLLRLYLPRMGWWVAATLGGWLVGVGLALLPGWLGWAGPWFTVPLAFLVMGFAIGVAQWLLLRRRLPQAGWWVGANVAGWGVLALLAGGNAIGLFELLAIGLLPACATAGMLALLLPRGPRPGPQGA